MLNPIVTKLKSTSLKSILNIKINSINISRTLKSILTSNNQNENEHYNQY